MTNERLQHPIKKVMIWPNAGKEGMGLAVRQAADVLREFGAGGDFGGTSTGNRH